LDGLPVYLRDGSSFLGISPKLTTSATPSPIAAHPDITSETAMNSKTATTLNKAPFRAVGKDWVRYFILKIITEFPRQRASIILMEGIN
jgi:hypothetical protein